MLGHPLLQRLAAKHGKSPAQVVLRWHLELGNIIFPKSKTPKRIEENMQIFDFSLDEDDLQQIAGLNEDRRLGPDPSTLND